VSVTVTPTVEASNVPPRIRLDVSASAGEASTTVLRLDANGTTVPVRTTDGNPLPLSSGVGLLYDYEVPFQTSVAFSTAETPGTISASVTAPEARIWLIHPGVPSLSMPVAMMLPSLMSETYSVKQGVFYPMGRANPIVVTDGARSGAASTLVALVENLSDIKAIRNLVADAGVLFLNIPASMNLGFDTCYIAVGEVQIARLTDVNANPSRTVSLPFVVVDRPAGGSQAQRTLADLLDFPTLAALKSYYPTLLDLAAGP
jgi:hypothetical protein